MANGRRRPGVLCAGRLYCDLIFTDVPRFPTLGTEVYAGGLGVHAGGGAYITAAYLASMGEQALLAGYIPRAPFGAPVSAEIAMAGVDAALCRATPSALDPQITVSVTASGDRAFLTRRVGPAVPDITAADLSERGIGHVHVGELATLVEHPWLIDRTRAAGATLSLDCGWDEALKPDGLSELLAAVDVFLPNEAEVRHLETLGLPGNIAPLTVVKRGAKGARAISNGQEVSRSALEVDCVDTTGAGDAFNAGFLRAWRAGRSLGACLAEGNAAGARAISGRGGFHVVDLEDAPTEDTLALR